LAYRSRSERFVNRFVELLDEAMAAGEIRPVNSRLLAHLITQTAAVVRDEEVLTALGLTAEEAMREIEQLVWRGVRAGHTLSDVMVSVGVIISLVIVRLGWEQADGIVALLVAVVIFRTAWGILRGVLHTLGDAARLPADEVAVAACVVPDVVSCHAIRTRGSRSHVYVDLHVQVAPGTTVVGVPARARVS